MQSDPNFLSTYGEWGFEAFAQCFPDEPATLMIVIADAHATGEAARERTDTTIHHVWDSVLSMFDPVHGHRASWDEMFFLFTAANIEGLAQKLAPVVRSPAGCDCKVSAALRAVGPTTEDRLANLMDLEWRLAKADYRGEWPDAWCMRDGEIVRGC